MKKALFALFCSVALILTACSSQESASNKTPEPTAATPAPTETPAPTPAPGDLSKVKASAEKALTEYKAKNYAAASEDIAAAHKELGTVVASTAAAKPLIETATKNIETIKTMAEKKDPKVEKSLTSFIASLGKIGEANSVKESVKEAAAGAAGAVKGAASTAAETMKPAEKKAKPVEKKP